VERAVWCKVDIIRLMTTTVAAASLRYSGGILSTLVF
jgi:hypothetical protein